MAKARNYHIKMSEQGYEALAAIAAEQRKPLADVVREALEEYAKRQGHEAKFSVERGGDRRSEKVQ